MRSPLISAKAIPRLDIRSIDAEHEMLVERVNELHEAMLTGRGHQALSEILSRLIAETRAHFATEEALMLEHGYPEYEKHKSDHARLIDHVIDLERQFREGQLLLSFAIMLELKNWATIHIDVSDRPLGAFLRARAVT